MNVTPEQIFLINPSNVKTPLELQKHDPDEQVNLENVEDFSNVCRTCATITDLVIPIFDGEGRQNNLAEKITTHLPIQVSDSDTLPTVVCYQCYNTLLAWHELVQCCVQADKALRTRQAVLAARRLVEEPDPGPSHDAAVDSVSYVDTKEWKYSPSDWSGRGPDGSDRSDDDDLPLAHVATDRNKTQLYRTFYRALVNFRNHYVETHAGNKSDSEHVISEEDAEYETNKDDLDTFDDLTQLNMRKDRMDEETRKELSEVYTKINGKVYYTCKMCGKNLSSAHTYVYHKRIHTGERPCVCHLCGKQFRAPNGLRRHLTETHQKVKRHCCVTCGKNFANSQNLKQHTRIHTGEKPFVCLCCGKRFTQSGSLYVHLKTHVEHFPFECAECGAKFRLRAGLARHRLKHSGERAHLCALCGRAFRQRHELRAHAALHSAARPHACARCHAAFRQRRALAAHCRRLHPPAPAPTPLIQ